MYSRPFTISNSLGANKSSNIVINSILFAILSFFYLLTIGSLLQPTIYPLLDRVTYSAEFVDIYFINEFSDSLVIVLATILWFNFAIINRKKFLFIMGYGILTLISFTFGIEILKEYIIFISLPLIIASVLLTRFQGKKFIDFDWRLSVNYISMMGIIIGILSICIVLISIIMPELTLPSMNYLYYIFLIMSVLSPLYLINIAASYPLNKVFTLIGNKINSFVKPDVGSGLFYEKLQLRLGTRIITLSLIICLSIALAIIPHLDTVNPDDQIIGSDTNDYVRMLTSVLDSSSISDFLNQAFVIQLGGDRPFSLLFFLGLSTILSMDNLPTFLEFLPILLGPMLILSIYFVTLQLSGNHVTSILASLFTIPFHILIGIYGGLYANWFSLTFGYLSILFLFRSLKKPTFANLFFFSILLIILLFCHTPTWTIFMYVIILFILVIAVGKLHSAKVISRVSFAILPSILIDIAKMILINKSGVLQELSFATNRVVGFQDIHTIWSNLIDTSHLYMAGLIGNPIILLLVIYWVLRSKIKEPYVVFVVIFFSISSLPILFAEQEIQTRFYYEIPFQIPAAMGLTMILRRNGVLLVSTICFWMIIIAIRAVSNFYFLAK